MIDNTHQHLSPMVSVKLFSYTSVLGVYASAVTTTQSLQYGRKAWCTICLKRENAWTENYYYYRRLDKHTFTVYHFALGEDWSMVINGFDFFLSIQESLVIFWPSGLIFNSFFFLRWAGILCAYSNHLFFISIGSICLNDSARVESICPKI